MTIVYPLDKTYTNDQTIPILGMATGESWLSERDYVIVTVNGSEKYEMSLEENHFFAEEVYLEEGKNIISIEDNSLSVFVGEEEKPPAGFSPVFGHKTIDDTCDQCHGFETGDDGRSALVLLEPPDILCNWCHYQIVTGEEGKKSKMIHQPVREGKCLSCHMAHASTTPSLLKKKKESLCQDCHKDTYENMETKAYVHGPLNLGDCSICHENHAGEDVFLLNAPEREVCLRCHGGMGIFSTEPADIKLHPGINEGRCHECHSGHYSSSPKMMKKIVNNLCIDCHSEKSRNFHDEKGFSIYICGRCHNVHRPDSANLIIKESKNLCIKCHENLFNGQVVHRVAAEGSCFECHGFHRSSMEKSQMAVCSRCHPLDTSFTEAHPVEMNETVECTGCHSPHSAANTSLTYPIGHKPFLKKECNGCHRQMKPGEMAGMEAGGLDQLCFNCHPQKKIPEERPAGLIVHKPFSQGGCRSCHLPHNSNFYYLLQTDPLDLCSRCHSFVKKIKIMKPPSIHEDVANGHCGSCHDSHLGYREKLLKEEGGGLCLKCHSQITGSVPGAPYPVMHKPLVTEGCLGCHAGHSSSYAHLLLKEKNALCKNCHLRFYRGLDNPANRIIHDPVKKGACEKCHLVHGGPFGNLLVEEGNWLCRKCHENLRRREHHLYQKDYLTHTAKNLAGRHIECLECHNSHYSSRNFMTVRSDSEVCQACHGF